MVTLKDVAQRAGVSVSTVSYVLNGKKTVRPETLKRINDAIEELEYCPNLAASSLKTNQSKIIGVIVSDMLNLYFVNVLAVIEQELKLNGYSMVLCNSQNDREKEKDCLRDLLAHNIDGVMLIGTGGNDYSAFRRMQTPMVCVDRISDEDFFTVRTDNVLGGRMGTECLIQKGYKKIVYIGNPEYDFSRERCRGYEQAMRTAGLEKKMDIRNVYSLDISKAAVEIEELLSQNRDYEAVFASTDNYAICAMKALARAGRKVPEEVGVMGFDDVIPASFSVPELTTVAQPKEEMGRVAVQALMRLLAKESIHEKQVLLKPVIVERESC